MTTSRTFATPLHFAPTRHATRTRLASTQTPRAPLALFAIVPTIALTVAMVLAASLIGPFILFAIPLMLCFGCAIGPLHALLRGEL